jgi:acetolactate synthase-1/2/3 large subunit
MPAADVVARVLRQAGATRAFATGAAPEVLAAALARAGLDVVEADARSAVLMAAVTGVLTDAPGLVVAGADEPPADALAHAAADRAPLILLTERPPADRARPGADRLAGGGAGAGVRTVLAGAASAAHQAAHACQAALRPPRGPVWLVLGAADARRPAVPVAVAPRPGPAPPPDPRAVAEAARRIASADRPVVVAGLGCRDPVTAFWLRPFVEALPAPVVVTRAARGVVPDAHPLVLGRPGQEAARRVLERADLVVALGLDPREAADLPPGAPALAVGALGGAGLAGVAHEVTADVAPVLEELAAAVKGRSRSDWDVAALDRLKRAGQRASPREGPPAVARQARRAIAGEAVAACEPDDRIAAVEDGWCALAPLELLVAAAPVAGFAPAAATAAALAAPARRALAFTTAEALGGAGDLLRLAAARRLDVTVVAFGPVDPGVPGVEVRRPAAGRALAAALGQPGPAVVAVTAPV